MGVEVVLYLLAVVIGICLGRISVIYFSKSSSPADKCEGCTSKLACKDTGGIICSK